MIKIFFAFQFNWQAYEYNIDLTPQIVSWIFVLQICPYSMWDTNVTEKKLYLSGFLSDSVPMKLHLLQWYKW